MPLKVAAGTSNNRFCRQLLNTAVGEVQYVALSLLIILGTVDRFDSRNCFFNSVALTFKVVPDDAVRLGIFGS